MSRETRVRRPGVWVLGAIGLVIVLLVVVQGLAGFYTNFLWFHYSGVGVVWQHVVGAKIDLVAFFIIVAFLLFWGCLFIVDKVAPRALFMAPDTELVRRYQTAIGPHAFAVRTLVALVLAAIVGAGTSNQWQHWILFEHAVPFHGANSVDPVFHRNVSFFVFRLPFLSFLVNWIMVALIVAFIMSATAYFLNGAVRLQGIPRVEPRALAHLSLLGGLMALERAWAYYFVDRYTLDLSHNGFVNGASYTDVHVRLPAMTLLAVVSLVAFMMLVFNAYQRTWVLPAIAFGTWAFLAIVLGAIYPAVVQVFQVTPAQSSLEKPYIERNIAATQQAFDIASIKSQQFPANQDLTPGVIQHYQETLNDTDIWDPLYTTNTYQNLQKVRGYYSLTSLSLDRYPVNGSLVPTVVGVRTINSANLPTQSWVNTHLEYTHGYGSVVSYANQSTSSGNPKFIVSSIPPTSTEPSLKITQPSVYFAPGDSQYVIADTKQLEVDYPSKSSEGANVSSHYKGSGGIPVSSLATRVAFAVHLRDFNLLVSSNITNKSRLIYIPDVQAMVQKALPFLQVDTHPYSVIDHGQIKWVVDAYTTSNYYPYAQQAPTGDLLPGSGLAGTYNYVRDAVKVVINAYSGKMQFYTIDAKGDPLMRSYEAAFPKLFQPLSSLANTDPTLLQHLRYPQDLLMIQSAMYGRYHVSASNEQTFYTSSQAWNLSQITTSLSGRPSDSLPVDAAGSTALFTPTYEMLQLPGESKVTFSVLEPLVPQTKGSGTQLRTLSAFVVANSSAQNYGKLSAYTVANSSVAGPSLVNAAINANANISKQITLLNSGGSQVYLGTVMTLPIADSLLYVRPLYVSSSQASYPQLQDVIAVYGSKISLQRTLDGALASVFGSSITGSSGSGTSSGSGSGSNATVPSQARQLVADALSDYQDAQTALSSGNLGTYQSDVTKAGQSLAEANSLLNAATKKTPAATTKKAVSATQARAEQVTGAASVRRSS